MRFDATKLTVTSILISLCCGSSDAAFYLPDQIPKPPLRWKQAQEATHRLSINEEGSCSGVALSPDGYFLTALHCMDSCLSDLRNIPEQMIQYTKFSDPLHGVVEYLKVASVDRIPQKSFCQSPENNYINWDWLSEKPQIVFLGESFAYLGDERKIQKDVLTQLVSVPSSDFAILKYDLKEKVQCVPLATRRLQNNESIWSLGYPTWTHRGDGHDSNGALMYASVGQVRSSILVDPRLKTPSVEIADLLKSLYDTSWRLLANLDGRPGSSGGPLFNNRGELTGIVTGSFKPTYETLDPTYTFLNSTSLGLQIDVVYSEVVSRLGKDKADQIFSCGQ